MCCELIEKEDDEVNDYPLFEDGTDLDDLFSDLNIKFKKNKN